MKGYRQTPGEALRLIEVPDYGWPENNQTEKAMECLPLVVTGITVQAKRLHEHDKQIHAPGEVFTIESNAASLLIQRGLVEFIRKEVAQCQ
jgi:hypothetical protein